MIITPKQAIERYAPFVIIAGALLVSIPRLAAVFAAVEPAFLGLPTAIVTGPGYGIATSGCALYVWHIYQERNRLKLAPWLLVGWAILLVIIAIILTPAIMAELRNVPLASLLPFPLDLLWSMLLSVSSELVVGLAALATAIAKDGKQSASASQPSAKPEPRPAKTYAAVCGFCDWKRGGYETERAAKNATNAHRRKHKEDSS